MNLKEVNPRLVASEVFGNSVCNLQCEYCYIPRNEAMKRYYDKLVEVYKDGTFINNLKSTYGEQLCAIGIWGTEPTLVLQYYVEMLDNMLDTFPRLNEFNFSTNLQAHPERIVDFCRALENNKYGRQVRLRFQVSIDGDSWITDNSRGVGSTEKILHNLKILFTGLKELELKNLHISFDFKPTVPVPYLRDMSQDMELLIGWFRFFDNLLIDVHEAMKGKERNFYCNTSICPTLVVPGKYTREDGIFYNDFCKATIKLEKFYNNKTVEFAHIHPPFNNYQLRLNDFMNNVVNMLWTQPENTTCSGGDTQNGFGYDGHMYPCHRYFLYEDSKYVEDIIKGQTDSIFRNNATALRTINKKLIIKPDSTELEKLRYFFVYRSYHDFPNFKIVQTDAMIRELAKQNQINRIYLENDKVREMLAMFLNTKMSCPADNYLETGSLHVIPISLIRIFANGAFETMLKYHYGQKGM